MKTIDDLNEICNRDGDEYVSVLRAMENAFCTFVSAYRDTLDMAPADTVSALVAMVGYDMAVSVVATLVNNAAWDGRISRRAAEWARTAPQAWDGECCLRFHMTSDYPVHRAHLDQIACALIRQGRSGA